MDCLSIRKSLTSMAAVAFFTAAAQAQTSYTIAAGYVQVTVPGTSLGAVSATLQNKSDHTSNGTINDDWAAGIPQPFPTPDIPARQTITVAGAGWTDDQFTGTHLCYIIDSEGGEEAFLVYDNTADTLTVASDYDLLDPLRNIPSVASISIRKAQTVTDLFGEGVGNTDFTQADKVYLWSGSGWTTYFVDANLVWKKIGSFFNAGTDVVYPDEGIFLQRNDANPITLTFFGDVPGNPQVTTMAGPGLQFVSSRYPVATTIGQLGFETLPGWQEGSAGDLVYIWTGTGWTTYFYTTTGFNAGWKKIGSFLEHSADPVLPDSALFVSRKGASNLAESTNQHALPYTP